MRASDPHVSEGRHEPAQLADAGKARLARWRSALKDYDGGRISTRLAWSGISEGDLPRLLNPSEEDRHPQADLLLDAVEKAVGACSTTSDPASRLYAGFADYALGQLFAAKPDAAALCTEQALADLRSEVMEIARNLFREVRSHERSAFLLRLDGSASEADLRERFDRVFAQEAVELARRRHRALLPLTSTSISEWVESTRLFLDRFERDRVLLSDRFARRGEDRRIQRLRLGASDKHSGGRSVIGVQLSDGSRVVYKPRSLRADRLFAEIVERLFGPGRIKVPDVVDRGDYGWAEHIEEERIQGRDAAARYYERCGYILFALYLLNAADMHEGNLIAHGECPVLVDLETSIHQSLAGTNQERAGIGRLAQTVFRTGLLPRWSNGPGGSARSTGGLSAREGRSSNMPTLSSGEPLPAADYVDEIVTGFREAYRSAMGERSEAVGQLLRSARVADIEFRFVFRGTEAYTRLLRSSVHPVNLVTSLDRSLALEQLASVFLARKPGDPPLPPDIFFHELEEMERGHVPIFHSHLGSQNLYSGSNLIASDFFPETVPQLFQQRCSQLSGEDLEYQSDLIQVAFDIQRVEFDDFGKVRPPAENAVTRAAAAEQDEQDDPARYAGGSSALHVAEMIGAYLIERSIVGPNGELDWIVPRFRRSFDRYTLSTVDHSLFQGRAGIALFLAALARATGADRFRGAALDTLAPTLEQLTDRGGDAFVTAGIGAMTGAFGMVYGLAATGQLLELPHLVETAIESASVVSVRQLLEDDHLDLVAGAAGVLRVLQFLERSAEAKLESPKAACLERILDARRDVRDGCGWVSADGRMLGGLSHGAAGIALALSGVASSDAQAACEAAIRFENQGFDREAGNWLDLRFDRRRFGMGWSHGAPGIGIARLSMKPSPESGSLDVARALQAITRFRGTAFDYVVSGRASHLIFLAMLCRDGREESAAAALRDQVDAFLAQAKVRGHFNLPLKPGKVMTAPGLFNGLAGIGLTLLQASDPAAVWLPEPWTLG